MASDVLYNKIKLPLLWCDFGENLRVMKLILNAGVTFVGMIISQ